MLVASDGGLDCPLVNPTLAVSSILAANDKDVPISFAIAALDPTSLPLASQIMQTNDGQITEPYSISAGLDYPGVGPMHANLYRTGRAEFISITDDEAMTAGLQLSQLEGIIPAIETSHALAVFDHKTFNPDDLIVLNLSGRGDKDLQNYIEYFKL